MYPFLVKEACNIIIIVTKKSRIIPGSFRISKIYNCWISIGYDRRILITIKREVGIKTRFTTNTKVNDIIINSISYFVPFIFRSKSFILLRNHTFFCKEMCNSIDSRRKDTPLSQIGNTIIRFHKEMRNRSLSHILICFYHRPNSLLISFIRLRYHLKSQHQHSFGKFLIVISRYFR